MPLYDYQCDQCGHRFEVRQGIKEDPLTECPQCGSPIRRVIHPVGIVFKGSGFYITDSRNKSSATSPAGESAGAEKTEKKETPAAAASSSTESKPAASAASSASSAGTGGSSSTSSNS